MLIYPIQGSALKASSSHRQVQKFTIEPFKQEKNAPFLPSSCFSVMFSSSNNSINSSIWAKLKHQFMHFPFPFGFLAKIFPSSPAASCGGDPTSIYILLIGDPQTVTKSVLFSVFISNVFCLLFVSVLLSSSVAFLTTYVPIAKLCGSSETDWAVELEHLLSDSLEKKKITNPDATLKPGIGRIYQVFQDGAGKVGDFWIQAAWHPSPLYSSHICPRIGTADSWSQSQTPTVDNIWLTHNAS